METLFARAGWRMSVARLTFFSPGIRALGMPGVMHGLRRHLRRQTTLWYNIRSTATHIAECAWCPILGGSNEPSGTEILKHNPGAWVRHSTRKTPNSSRADVPSTTYSSGNWSELSVDVAQSDSSKIHRLGGRAGAHTSSVVGVHDHVDSVDHRPIDLNVLEEDVADVATLRGSKFEADPSERSSYHAVRVRNVFHTIIITRPEHQSASEPMICIAWVAPAVLHGAIPDEAGRCRLAWFSQCTVRAQGGFTEAAHDSPVTIGPLISSDVAMNVWTCGLTLWYDRNSSTSLRLADLRQPPHQPEQILPCAAIVRVNE